VRNTKHPDVYSSGKYPCEGNGSMAEDKALTKSQIIAHLAESNGLTKAQVDDVLESLAQLAYQEAKRGFTIPGIGKLVVVERAARMGRNPATGEAIQIPAKSALKFRLAKAAKDAVASGK
jgi:DNA-binding protein HU-beta